MAGNSFGARAELALADRSYEIFRLDALASVADDIAAGQTDKR